MSDRIGIMREGRMVQIGTPAEIYNWPVNKFVAQFMGEVNTIEVTRNGDNAVKSLSGDMTFSVARLGGDFDRGFLIVRPEVVKIGPAAEAMPNRVNGKLFNDYALGSRIQYQVRGGADDYNWLVEKLQDAPYEGALGDAVTIGWRPEDSILVKD